MSEGMIHNAITNLETKYVPQKTASDIYVPQEAYRSLYDLLDIWGENRDDNEVQSQTKYIFDKLSETKQDIKQQLLSIINSIGVIPTDDTRINRVWKYLHLKDNALKARSYYNTLVGELEQLRAKKEAKKK